MANAPGLDTSSGALSLPESNASPITRTTPFSIFSLVFFFACPLQTEGEGKVHRKFLFCGATYCIYPHHCRPFAKTLFHHPSVKIMCATLCTRIRYICVNIQHKHYSTISRELNEKKSIPSCMYVYVCAKQWTLKQVYSNKRPSTHQTHTQDIIACIPLLSPFPAPIPAHTGKFMRRQPSLRNTSQFRNSTPTKPHPAFERFSLSPLQRYRK